MTNQLELDLDVFPNEPTRKRVHGLAVVTDGEFDELYRRMGSPSEYPVRFMGNVLLSEGKARIIEEADDILRRHGADEGRSP